jgi:hypothetical protein
MPIDEVVGLVLGQRLEDREAEAARLRRDRELRGVSFEIRIVRAHEHMFACALCPVARRS